MNILNNLTPLQQSALQALTDAYNVQAKTNLTDQEFTELNMLNQIDSKVKADFQATAAQLVTQASDLSDDKLSVVIPQIQSIIANA